MKLFQIKIKRKLYYGEKEQIRIRMILKNCSGQDYYICLGNTLFQSMQGKGISLYRGEKSIEYDGVYEKALGMWENIICLGGKQQLERNLRLEDMFEIKNLGCYGIVGKIHLYYAKAEEKSTGQISWNSLIVRTKKKHFFILKKRSGNTKGQQVRRREKKKRELDIFMKTYPEPEIYFEREAEFHAWYKKERREEISAAIREAHYELIYYIKSCIRQLEKLEEEPDYWHHYERAFGDWKKERASYVKLIYELLLRRLREEKIYYRYDMELAVNCCGYTFRNTRTIWLGTGFLAAGTSGENSRIGILVHELVLAMLGIGGKEGAEETLCGTGEACPASTGEELQKALQNPENYEKFTENCFIGWNQDTVWENTKKAGIAEFGGPKIIVFEDKLHLFYMDQNGLLRASVMGEPGKQPDEACGFSEAEILAYHPEAVVYENRLYLFYIPFQEEGLYVTYQKDGKWVPGRQIKDREGTQIKPVYPPKPVVYQNRIYLVYWKRGESGLYMISRGNAGWSSEQKIADLEGGMASCQPSLIVSHGELYMIYGTAESSILYYGIYRGEEQEWEMGRTISPNLGLPFLAKGAIETVGDENGFHVFISEQFGGIIELRMNYNQFLGKVIWTEGRQVAINDWKRGQRYSLCSSVRWRDEVWIVYQKDDRSIILNRKKY